MRNYGENVELQIVTTDEYHSSGDADVVIFNGALPLEHSLLNKSRTKNYVFINWRSELPGLTDAPAEMVSTIVNVIGENKIHPTMQNVSLIGMSVKEICE